MQSHISRNCMGENVPMPKRMLMKTHVATVMRVINGIRNG